MNTHPISAPRSRARSRNVVPASPPVWPLPALNGRSPVVIARNSKTSGLDLAYARVDPTDLISTYPIGANGTTTHFMPSMMPAFAARDGEITYAGKQAHGHAVLVDHRNGWATYYTNLEHMFALPTGRKLRRDPERVKAGDVLGYIGAPEPGAFKCLHFELWKLGDDYHFGAVDPSAEMSAWLVLPWTDERLTPTEAARLVAAA